MTEMPTWEGFMVPVLQVLTDGQVRTLRELRAEVSGSTGLSATQRAEELGSGQSRAANRIGWAASFLTRVDALHRPARGRYEITDLGRELLAAHPDGLTEADLKTIAKEGDEWWIARRGGRMKVAPVDEPAGAAVAVDPTEQIEDGIDRIREAVAAELLEHLLDQDPEFFEHAVVELLLAMGYGGAGGRGMTTALSHDGGIDGVIDQDVLGLDKVYVQAKRYAPGNAVQRPEVQGFVGALTGKASRGVFITTSRFSPGAVEWVAGVPMQIILIDGERLADLMIEFNVGVQTARTYRVVEVDEDFFT
ncbi:MAG: restriction endonuclease [Actinobacteria bacterium]|nr:restriction endonuclease [Actinomycetota bacterium]